MATKNLTEIFSNLEANKGNMEFLPTGFTELDTHLDGGLLRKELIVMGGATGIGKSYVAGQILWNIAQKGFSTAYFSLEISNEMVVSRMIGSLSNIKPTRILCGLLEPHEFNKKIEAKAKLSVYESFMSFYDDVYKFEELRKEIQDKKYEFVVIDFVQNIVHIGMDEYSRLSYVSLELQKLAKECNCCIVLLSQLSNAIAKEGKKSSIEFKGSGSIATVADLAFFIEREDGWDATENKVRIFLRKNRRGIGGVSWDYTFVQPGGFIK